MATDEYQNQLGKIFYFSNNINMQMATFFYFNNSTVNLQLIFKINLVLIYKKQNIKTNLNVKMVNKYNFNWFV